LLLAAAAATAAAATAAAAAAATAACVRIAEADVRVYGGALMAPMQTRAGGYPPRPTPAEASRHWEKKKWGTRDEYTGPSRILPHRECPDLLAVTSPLAFPSSPMSLHGPVTTSPL
jgi:hypothetical protein